MEKVKKQNVGNIEGAVKWSSDKNNFKIKKVDQNGKPLKGVTFSVYNTKLDAEKEINSIGSAISNNDGDVIFNNLPPYYGFYIKETKVPEGYTKSDEIIPVYMDNGVRFLGEMNLTKLNSNIKGGINKNSLSNKYTKNLNTYLQGLTKAGTPFNNDTNWLVYNDNGVEKLVSKKPLKHSISWNSLYNAGVVFGEDGVKDLRNADFTNSNYSSSPSLKDRGKGKGTEKTYKPQYVNINGKTYIVRLMRAYNDNTPINDRAYTFVEYANTKGSEWNRLILPLIGIDGNESKATSTDDWDKSPYGRYGSGINYFIEANMSTLANYSWWKDFGGNNNNSGSYSKGNNCGVYRWAQEAGYNGVKNRAFCGNPYANVGAAISLCTDPSGNDDNRGWLVVLERVS